MIAAEGLATVSRMIAGCRRGDGTARSEEHTSELQSHVKLVCRHLLDKKRGYVLRRILRRAVRHALQLGRREPTLVHLVHAVGGVMGSVYPELVQKCFF